MTLATQFSGATASTPREKSHPLPAARLTIAAAAQDKNLESVVTLPGDSRMAYFTQMGLVEGSETR
jgi:hypothetical protein